MDVFKKAIHVILVLDASIKSKAENGKIPIQLPLVLLERKDFAAYRAKLAQTACLAFNRSHFQLLDHYHLSEKIVAHVPHPQLKVGDGMHETKRKGVHPFLATLYCILVSVLRSIATSLNSQHIKC